MIIGLNGYSGSGKDAVGTIIQYLTSKYKPCAIEDCLKQGTDFSPYTDWEIKKWAGKLKTIASILTGIPVEKFEDQEFKKTEMSSEWDRQFYTEGEGWKKRPMLIRDFLQLLGTDGLRTGLHENTWVNALMSTYLSHADNWIVTDTRFHNEAEAIKKAGGIIIRIDRPGVKPINNHPSEISLDDWKFDHKIANVSDIQSLTATVESILKKENLL